MNLDSLTKVMEVATKMAVIFQKSSVCHSKDIIFKIAMVLK